jgi:hypothetical protein
VTNAEQRGGNKHRVKEKSILYDVVYSDAKHTGLLLTSLTSTVEVGK